MSIPVEQLAVVALNTVFNGVLRSGNDGAMFAAVCRDIGDLLETENNLIKVKEHIKEHKEYRAKWQTEAVKDKVYANKREAQMLTKKLRKIHSDEDEWDNAIKVFSLQLHSSWFNIIFLTVDDWCGTGQPRPKFCVKRQR